MLADWFLCQSNIPGSRLLMGSSLYCTNFDPLFECAFLWCRRMVGPPFISLSFLGPLRTGKRRACCSMLVPTLMQQTWWVRSHLGDLYPTLVLSCLPQMSGSIIASECGAQDGRTVIMAAARANNTWAVRDLLEAGANTDAQDRVRTN